MGRKKLEVKRIEDKSNRQVTFSKRRGGLMKKARELSVLCDVDVGLFIFSGRGRLYEFNTGESLRKILERFQGQGGSEEAASKSVHDPHMAKQIERDPWTTSNVLEMVQRQVEEEKVEQLNMVELTRLEHQLDAILRRTRTKKTQFMMDAVSALQEKEKEQREAKEATETELLWAQIITPTVDIDDGAAPLTLLAPFESTSSAVLSPDSVDEP